MDLRGLNLMDPTGLHRLVHATRRDATRAGQRLVVLVLVQGKQPIVRLLAVSGVAMAVETAADPATLDPLRP